MRRKVILHSQQLRGPPFPQPTKIPTTRCAMKGITSSTFKGW